MRVPRRATNRDVGFNMTPMIDVVFQLIIFFLLSSHLAKQEKEFPMPLPTAQSAQPVAQDDRPRLTVNVLSDGTLLVANRTMLPDDLKLILRERRKTHGEQLEVRIRGD